MFTRNSLAFTSRCGLLELLCIPMETISVSFCEVNLTRDLLVFLAFSAPQYLPAIKENNTELAKSTQAQFDDTLFLLSPFLWNFSLRQDRLSGDVPPHLVQPCYVALGASLCIGKHQLRPLPTHITHVLGSESI